MKTKILQFIMIFCVVNLTNAQNLITNGSMSAWTAGSEKPDGYSYSSSDVTPEINYAKSTEMYNETMNVLWLKFKNSSTGSSRAIITPTTTSELNPGNYKLTFYVKGSGYLRSVNLVHSNVKIATKFKTADAAVGGDSALVARPMGTSTAAQLISDWTKYEVTYVVTLKGQYQICFTNNNRNGDDTKPFLLANIVLENSEPSNDATLKVLTLAESAYTSEASGDVESVPGFSVDKLNYTVELSFNYAGGVPTVAGTANFAGASAIITQATNIIGTESERTASIEVTAQNGDKRTYTVTFVKSLDFINGFHFDATNLTNKGGWGYINSGGVYSKTPNSDGKYWGSATVRPTSDNIFEFYTSELTNGAGILSFYLKYSGYEDKLTDLQVQYRAVGTDTWTTLETIPANTLTDSWVEKIYTINNSSSTGQVRFFVDRTAEGLAAFRNFLIDDVRISAYSITSVVSTSDNPDNVNIKAFGNSIILKCIGSNMYQIFSSTGQLIQSGILNEYKSLKVDKQGLLIVKVGDYAQKVLIQ